MEVKRGVGVNKYIGSIHNGAAISACENSIYSKSDHTVREFGRKKWKPNIRELFRKCNVSNLKQRTSEI